MSNPQSHLCTLWIGTDFGAMECACLRSAIRHGHTVTLYCYDPPNGVPAGVAIADAASILPADRIIRHHTGSVALFSNLFRYELLRRELGTWIDTDVYLLRPIPNQEYVFGRQWAGWLNGAVLKLPAQAPLLTSLLEMFDGRSVPYWLPRRALAAAWVRRLTTGRSDPATMPWGTFGPAALTALSRRFGVYSFAAPSHVFYPAPYELADWIFDAGRMGEFVEPDTIAIHLWNERIKRRKTERAVPDSFFERLLNEGA